MSAQKNIESWIRENLFDVVPVATAVMDKDFNVLFANKAFEQIFGEWKNRKCHAVYKNRESVCKDCSAIEVFHDGTPRISLEVGFDKEGTLTHYTKHTFPIKDDDGNISFLVEMSSDITETEKIKREHQLLFDQVPCNILIIDRDFRIVRTNRKIREMFGDIEGHHCYKTLKGLDHKCTDCTAWKTFTDGKLHTGNSIVTTKNGEKVYFHVTTVPLNLIEDSVDLVMEMAVDITHLLELEDELKLAHGFMEGMISSSMDGIFALSIEDDVTIFNPAACNIFNVSIADRISREILDKMLPQGFLDQVIRKQQHVYLPEAYITTADNEKRPVRLVGVQIRVDEKPTGMAFFIQDLREIKTLEKDKIEAERLAAVGQTVAGLAHGVKNLITGLEGGLYMLNSGMTKGNIERIGKGMDMLTRNIDRISTFIKEFLNFSKGRKILVEMNNPEDIAQEVVDLYATKAKGLGIELIFEQKDQVQPAPMDYEGMHECLTNLVGNAIDACNNSEENKKCHVWVSLSEKDGIIMFEVKDDGCGMDYEVKNKVFTSFFTTKGLGGTGIGLLMTKKIVQEHGGKVEMESEPGEGTTFKILLPRKRLPQLIDDAFKM